MSFSEKMRESLGAEGLRLELEPPTTVIARGSPFAGLLRIRAGSLPARVDSLILRWVQADRYWRDRQGEIVSDDEARSHPDRRSLHAAWSRRTVQTLHLPVGRDFQAHEEYSLPLELQVPDECEPSTLARCHTLNVQASVPGQIDPSKLARVQLLFPDLP